MRVDIKLVLARCACDFCFCFCLLKTKDSGLLVDRDALFAAVPQTEFEQV